MEASSISQLTTSVSNAVSSMSSGMVVVPNMTQPFTGGLAPTTVLKDSVTLASMFSTSLGSSQVSTNALSGITSSLSSTTSALSSTVGSLSSLSTFSTDLSSISGLSSITSSLTSIDADALASTANAAFNWGAEALKDPLSALGDTSLSESTSSAPKSLTVTDIYDPANIPTDWVFITAPQNVSWDKQGQTSVIDNFGTNNPYVVYSSTSMRKLSLGEVLIEGFSAGKEVEDHVLKLEAMMNMVQNTQKGYVSPYVWDLRAGDKSYGKFIIESLQIKEDMRNAKGRADRVTASISLQQVPDFQVSDGRDLATQADLASGQSVQQEQDKAATATSAGGDKVTPASSSKYDTKEIDNAPSPASPKPKA